jgi:hypothetical protein
VSAADLKRGASPPREPRPPVYGVCPRCGREGAFAWAGAGYYRCHGRRCGASSRRDEIKAAPARGAPAAKQALLFEEGAS